MAKMKMKTTPKIVIALVAIAAAAFLANKFLPEELTKPKVEEAVAESVVESVVEDASADSALAKAGAAVKNAVKAAKKAEAEEEAPATQLDASGNRGMDFLLNQGK